jgi:hypothetical protein
MRTRGMNANARHECEHKHEGGGCDTNTNVRWWAVTNTREWAVTNARGWAVANTNTKGQS